MSVTSVENTIREKLDTEFTPTHLALLNESHMHAGPATNSHFKLILVSEAFADLSPVRRHQAIYRALAEELAGEVHALAMHLYTPMEWQDAEATYPDSPECAGKNK